MQNTPSDSTSNDMPIMAHMTLEESMREISVLSPLEKSIINAYNDGTAVFQY